MSPATARLAPRRISPKGWSATDPIAHSRESDGSGRRWLIVAAENAYHCAQIVHRRGQHVAPRGPGNDLARAGVCAGQPRADEVHADRMRWLVYQADAHNVCQGDRLL